MFTVSINPNPSNLITQNGTVLTANEQNGIYQWVDCNNGNQFINGATDRNYAPALAGNYAALVSNSYDCQVLTNCINYSCIPATTPILSGDIYICNSVDTSVPVTITGGSLNNNTSWAWYSGSCNGELLGYGTSRNLGVGTYYVKGVAGCATDGICSSPFTVSFLNPQITITPVGNTLVTQNIPGAQYEWTDCNNPSVILGTESVFTPPTNGLYKVYVVWSYSASCASGDDCFQYNGSLSSNENEKLNYEVFPNPVEKIFQIKSKEVIEEINIYTLLGQLVGTFKNQNQYNIESLSSGIYTVIATTNRGKSNLKIIKK